MAHLTSKSAYQQLSDRLNRFPQGAPPNDLLFKILALLFSEREAALVSQLPVKPFTAKQAAASWQIVEAEARNVLEGLASRAILLDMPTPEGDTIYALPPPMAGFFEFSMMRVRGDIDQQLLSELYYEYVTVEEDFMRALLLDGETPPGRVFVNEPALEQRAAHHGPRNEAEWGSKDAASLQVLDYERASEVIRTAEHMGVSLCYCRHKKQHLDQACDKPLDICLTFGGTADSLIRHEYARRVDQIEGRDLLQKAYDLNLVQFGDNVREGVAFICNCCGCCCEAMIGLRKFGALMPIHSTNYIPRIVNEVCNGCGKCANLCPVEAMTLVSANDPHKPNKRKAKLNEDVCLGCGVCVRVCPTKGLFLEARPERIITPLNSVHRIVVMALERGNLQDLIFDNKALLSHRMMGAILGVILRLPPLKQALATQQVKSRYLERLVMRVKV
ncbi:Caffeyl-CoA reductase-Etf complex subunit CarE [Thermoflexales bacterium]|nr:Caffeyl-CoA reductase-Etf complex subunit CarE [Thermoflexales bacterium]